MNKQEIEKNFSKILENFSNKEKIDEEVFENTPKRMAELYSEIFSGLKVDPAEYLKRTFPCDSNGIVIEKDIEFQSMCEHHLLPFFGKIAIGYIPNGKIVGFGDLIKVIEAFAKRPQLQERLGESIAKTIYENLGCKGVCVHIEAQHMCMIMRGVKKASSKIVTLSSRGCFEQAGDRVEFLTLIGR
jgi:GTP cyclohydrolase I